jgi:ribonuclease P protein component
VETAKDRAGTESLLNGQSSFPRSARLLKPADFKQVFIKSSASTDRYFKILARPNGKTSSRLGLAVSRKVDKRAVGRNRIKRIVRESFRRAFETVALETPVVGGQVPYENGLDLVVLPRPLCASICNRELTTSLEVHWLRLKKTPGGKPGFAKREPNETGAWPADQTAGRK